MGDAEAIMSKYHISGVPITENGNRLVGILTNRDVRFVTDMSIPIHQLMTPAEQLVTAQVGTTLEDAVHILQEHRIEKLPLVDDAGVLKGLITVKDIMKKRDYPYRATDVRGRLLCGAAIGVGDAALARLAPMVDKGLDLVVIDTAHGHTAGVLETVERVKAAYPDLSAGRRQCGDGPGYAGSDLRRGRCGQSRCGRRLHLHHADCDRRGHAPDHGHPGLCREAHRQGVTVIADGGIKYSGDIVKALAAGADAVMLGSLLAGLTESPGELIIYEGRRFKEYRGMGSMGAMKGLARDRYGSGQGGGKHVPEGIEGQVPYKGNLADYVFQLMGGLRSGMGYVGARTLAELQGKRPVRAHHQRRAHREPSPQHLCHQRGAQLSDRGPQSSTENTSVDRAHRGHSHAQMIRNHRRTQSSRRRRKNTARSAAIRSVALPHANWQITAASRRPPRPPSGGSTRSMAPLRTALTMTPPTSSWNGPMQKDSEPELKSACRDILTLHSSTRERLPILDRFYRAVFEITGQPASILDLGCGLNPLACPGWACGRAFVTSPWTSTPNASISEPLPGAGRAGAAGPLPGHSVRSHRMTRLTWPCCSR